MNRLIWSNDRKSFIGSRLFAAKPPVPSKDSSSIQSRRITRFSGMDSRFDTSTWAKAEREGQAEGQAEAGPSSIPIEINSESEQQEEGLLLDDQEDDQDDEEEQPSTKRHRLLSPSLEESSKKKKSKGIIYISRIPPGMTPPKVRHLLEGFGDVERLYLQDGREKERKRGNEGRGAGEFFFLFLQEKGWRRAGELQLG